VGPRLELEVVKVEEGLCDGRVLFHKYEQRSAEEAQAQQREWDSKEQLREQRRKQQAREGMGAWPSALQGAAAPLCVCGVASTARVAGA
jgi:hypothetical protein